MGREDENINKQDSQGGARLKNTLFLSSLFSLLLLSGCTGFSPELLTGGNERERIIEEVLKRGRIYTIRAGDEETLIALLEDVDPDVRLTALKIMEANPSPVIYDAVLRATLDESDTVTDEAFRILLDHWEESRYSVLRGMNGTSASLILTSINVIEKKEAVEEAPYLLTLFSDSRNVIRSAASRTYAHLGSYDNPWFQALLGHSHSTSRLAAVETLPRFHNPDLIPRIISFISDVDPSIRKAALFGLSEFDTKALPFLHETLRSSDDDELRAGVLQIVEGISDSSSVPVLIRLMDDPNRKIALKSAEILLGLGADVVVPVLLEQLDQMDKPALMQSFVLSGKFKEERMLPVLVSYFDNPDPDLSALAIETVRSYGQSSSSYLLTQLASEQAVQSLVLGLLVESREPLLVYDSDKNEYRPDHIFLFFETLPEDLIMAYLKDVSLPSRIISALWNLYDIEITTGQYQKSKFSAHRESYPYFYYFREWEQYLLSSEASRASSFAYMQDFFETDDETALTESRILRETSDWYKRGVQLSFEKALNAGRDASEEELDLLDTYLESRRALVDRWRTLPSGISDLARLIFLRYSLDIETLSEEYDFFRSLPKGDIPSP